MTCVPHHLNLYSHLTVVRGLVYAFMEIMESEETTCHIG
jgi:hypothetical protein